MEWTDERPTKAGLYYQCVTNSGNLVYVVAVRVIETPMQVCVEFHDNPNEDGDPSGQDWKPVELATGCLWAGPLPSPPKVST